MIRLAAVCGLALAWAPALAQPGHAQPSGARDPDWPCQQIKVPELSLASVWAGPPVDPDNTAWSADPAVADLVRKLVPRRVPLEAAPALLHKFGQAAGEKKNAELLLAIAGVFNVLDQERDSVMAGLDRFGGRQKELATRIRAENEQLRALQNEASADPKAVQAMTQQVTWDVEVFQDRRQAVSYACEVPATIEQRLFSLAHAIQQEMQ